MASVLILSKYGDGVPLALKLSQEGHIVKMWIKEQKAKGSLDGYKNPSKVSDPHKMLDQYDLILSDMVGFGELCEELTEKGKLVLGGSTFNDKLELDREYGLKVSRSLLKGVKEPRWVSCDGREECEDYLEKATTPQAIKPLNNKPPYLTLISCESENRTIKSLIKERPEELFPCIVQEIVEGIEISTEGWFNGIEWVKPFNHTFEKKRFMEGDKGPNTGCMGNVVFTVEEDRLTSLLLEPLTDLLKKVKYIGPLDVNCIINEKEAYFLEFTSRFGYDAIQALVELLKVSLFDFLYGVASRQSDKVSVHEGFSGATRLTVPPYPTGDGAEELKGIKFLQVPNEAKRHVWLADTMKNKEGDEVCSGVDGVLGCVTARGETVRECKRRIYRTIKNVVLHQDVQYRGDILDGVEESIQKLREWGWLT